MDANRAPVIFGVSPLSFGVALLSDDGRWSLVEWPNVAAFAELLRRADAEHPPMTEEEQHAAS